MMKLALALIVKGSEEEAKCLDKCLENMSPHVDGIFITSTYKKGEEPNEAVNRVCAKYGANISYFQWTDDFSAARNYNFSKVPKDFDYVIWSDADDVWYGLDKLKATIEESPKDSYSFWYFYAYDEYNQPNVAHKKTMVIKNDGCATWKGRIHEDLQPERDTTNFFVEGIQRQHRSNDKRFNESRIRNEKIAKKEFEESTIKDPRYLWNYGNALLHSGKYKQAVTQLTKFLETSESDEEKYLTKTRLTSAYMNLGKNKDAENEVLSAIGLRPTMPDAFFRAGEFYFSTGNWDKAEFYYLQGLVRKPSYSAIIVFNPRDYDYNPMMMLANVYFNKGRPDLALPVLKGCLKIMPENQYVKKLVEEMEVSTDELGKAIQLAKEIDAETDIEKKRKMILAVPQNLQPHPAIMMIRNKYFIKTESSGKDIAYYCGETTHEWNPILFKQKGFGGSEEAVINLSREWSKMGYNVTVFNNCGPEIVEEDGVTYKPWWMFNPKDKYDNLIFWRHPKLCDHEMNSPKIIIDMHDVINKAEFNEKRLSRIYKVMVKSEAHKILFPNIPEEKFLVVPNGVDDSLFKDELPKNQKLMINTSSPDRSMDVLPKLFREIKRRVPDARLQWAYGWDIFDTVHKTDRTKMEWKANLIKEMEESGVEIMGRLPQHEIAKMYLEANILAYPTCFYEIDCISVRKAQLAKCVPVTTDFAALKETNKFGIKVHTSKTMDDWALPYQISFGLDEVKAQEKWVDECVKLLEAPIGDRSEMKAFAESQKWTNIANQWDNILK